MIQSAIKLTFLLGLVWAGLAAALLAQDGLYIRMHEGDTMHLVEIVLRQAQGQWPHLDFMTPIGVLATAPIAAFVQAGWGVGEAILASEALFAACLLPALWWIGISRLGHGWGALFGAICMVLAMALVHGESIAALSISMHYNRWAWALSFIAIVVAVVPSVRAKSATADGIILGLAFAALALIKVTYAVAFFPTVVLSLALQRSGRAFVVALGIGLLSMLALTFAAGPAIWPAYVSDLIAVSRSEIRSAPGVGLVDVVAAPAYLGGSILGLLGVIFLRQAKRDREGLLLLTLLPGFFFVTYQNFGNDPQWLYLVGLLLIVLRPAAGTLNGWGWDMRQTLSLAGAAAFAFSLPSLLNLAASPVRHFSLDRADYAPLLTRTAEAGDIYSHTDRHSRVTGNVRLPGFPSDEEEPVRLNGEELEECQLNAGTVPYFTVLTQQIEETGNQGRQILNADLFNALWLFGDFPALPGGAPWYYGGLPGGDSAELILVPTCPVLPKVRRAVLAEVAQRGWTLREIARGPTFVLTEIQRP